MYVFWCRLFVLYCSQLIFSLTLGNWKRHEFVHTGVKGFACQYCESKFTTHAGKKQHEKTHIGDKSYSCKFCDKSYVTSGKLRTHVLTKRSQENPPIHQIMWKLNENSDFTKFQYSVTKVLSLRLKWWNIYLIIINANEKPNDLKTELKLWNLDKIRFVFSISWEREIELPEKSKCSKDKQLAV